MRLSIRISVLVLVTLFAGCHRSEQRAPSDVRTFDVRGVVVEVDPPKKRVVIDHEEIPDYMMAMIMPFAVQDTTLLIQVQPGDTVVGTLAVSARRSWLQTLFVVGRGTQGARQQPAPAFLRPSLKVGDRFPDFSFINQDGRRLHMRDLDGRVAAFTFIYTRCPLPDFCIQMTSAFAEAQQELSRKRSLNGQWHLLTMSFDPAFDTPEILRSYGKAYGADFATWDFVTDSLEVILQVAGALGLVVQDQGGGDIIHNLRTVVLGKDRRIAKIFEGNDWTTSDLVAAIGQAARE